MTDYVVTVRVFCVVCGRGVLPHEMADGRCAMCLREERDLARWERDEARKQGRCQCSDDDACRYARERDEAQARVTTLEATCARLGETCTRLVDELDDRAEAREAAVDRELGDVRRRAATLEAALREVRERAIRIHYATEEGETVRIIDAAIEEVPNA